ncbi:MAG: DNA polymerase III subunit gamma/tau, partial [Polaribacter sp.]|nr:DNA polymerase III subunit gamma/tau [Polaribacter sp.]
YIIPATFFQALSPAAKEISKPIQKKPEDVQSQKLEEPKPKVKTPVLKSAEKRSSSLSLKSIHQKKQEKKLVVEENFDNHPKTIFTEKLLQQFWKEYVDLLNKKGERSMASIVGTDVPRLKQHFKISFTVPNKLMQDQFKKGRPKLLNFLREKLNNYGIKIDAILNETVEKKFAYTPLEKFNKLKEKNPLLEKLRQSFELDM